MSRPTDRYWRTLPSDFLRGKYLKDPNPQYHEITEIISKIGGSALDVGCASCIMYPLLKSKGIDYTGLDITEKFLEHAMKLYPDLETRQGSILDIPFPPRSFDTVFCKSLMLHLNPKDMPKAISEMMRVASRYAIIGFRRTPRKTLSKLFRYENKGGCFYVTYRREDVEKAIKSSSKFKNLDVLPSKKWRGRTGAIYVIELCARTRIGG